MEGEVHVIMATYNGALYIREQIESILNQTYKNLKLYIFDDGSTDGTLDIIKEYESERVIILSGKRLGYPQSFFKLLIEAGGADYYSFSDQDDVWFPNKIEMAIQKLSKVDKRKRYLYFSRFNYCDKNMKFLRAAEKAPEYIPFRKTFFQCYLWGFTVVVNESMRKELIHHLPHRTKMKDYWMHLVSGGRGHFIYDERISANHRRHGKNHSEDPTEFIKFQMWRIKHFLLDDTFTESHDLLKEFYEIYQNRLPEKKKRELKLFQSDGNRLKKVFYPYRLRSTWSDEIMLRIVFLIGKL